MKFNINVKEWNGKKLYSAPLHDKPINDEMENTYWLDVQFSKCEAPTENCYINVDYGFMSCYKSKDDTIKPKLIIMQWTKLESKSTPKSEMPKTESKTVEKTSSTVENILKANAQEEPEEDLPF